MKRKSATPKSSFGVFTFSTIFLITVSIMVGLALGLVGGYTFREMVDTVQAEVEVRELTSVTARQAVLLLKKTPPISDYLAKFPETEVDVVAFDPEKQAWHMHVYTQVGERKTTFGWFRVDVQTGEVVEFNL